jgi:Na+-translocating ferredoxin:NAD+ oxidoreductase subunit B
MEVPMHEETYRRLATHLDRLPGGFGAEDEAVEQRLLQMLFTPEEAELATYLTLEREPPATIAGRAGLPVQEAAPRLEEMARKGLIMPFRQADGTRLYQALPYVVGIWEFQVDRQDRAWLRASAEYFRNRRPKPSVGPRQMRTIPIGESIAPHLEVLPHEQVDALVAGQERFAVMPCICRRTAHLWRSGCDAPEESCLVFGDWADQMVETGRGRAIDRKEVTQILRQADKANLVLQPSNAIDPSFICTCCSCCCGVLAGLKHEAVPADAVANPFYAHYESDLCVDCGACLTRCPMDALTQGEGRVVQDAGRCIGCGLCVSTCPSGALTLARKAPREALVPPDTMEETWRQIVRAQDALANDCLPMTSDTGA